MAKQIDTLTSTRGFAALMVVIFHFGSNIPPFKFISVFQVGNLAVSYFFVLSGFVMFITYYGKDYSYSEYFKRRIARIVPLYILAIVLSIIPPLLLFALHKMELPIGFTTALLLNVSFLQAYFPRYVYLINAPGWSLCAEMLFYLLFPLILPFLSKKYKQKVIVIIIVFFFISQISFFYLLKNARFEGVHEMLFYNPVFHLNQFLIGILGGYYYYRNLETKFYLPSWFCLALILFTMKIFNMAALGNYLNLHNGLLAPLFIIFIISTAKRKNVFLRAKVLVFLGEISFGIYLLQRPIHYYVCDQINRKFMHLNDTMLFYFYVVVLVIVSAISYIYFEKPLRNRINSIRTNRNLNLQSSIKSSPSHLP
jgi:peptidoglycan/LPS O-acetylase OafA/YrhL